MLVSPVSDGRHRLGKLHEQCRNPGAEPLVSAHEKGPEMAPVIDVSPTHLVSRREGILNEIGLDSYASFVECERLGLLTDTQWSRVDELHAIAFLLGEDEERA